ncbi:MAG: hypothetical protein IJ180_05225 [Bacteroidales bacterium]|nr:hypothetical protein [Bacteroidales bacterium]
MRNVLIILLFTLFTQYSFAQNTDDRINRWQEDSVGCLKLRNDKLADSLLKDYDLYGKDVKTFREIFGKENR